MKVATAYSNGWSDLAETLGDLLGVSKDLIDVKMADYLDVNDVKKASQGDVQAIENIRDAFAQVTLEDNDISGSVEGLKNELNNLAELGNNIHFDNISDSMVASLIQAQLAAGSSVEQIQNMFSGLGFDIDLTALDALEDKSAETADNVIRNTSFTQDVEPTQAEVESDMVDYQVEETVQTKEPT